MAIVRLNNISQQTLRWAVRRAGLSEEGGVNAFPLLRQWLDGDKLPTLAQLTKFASKFHVPLGYLFLRQPPQESIPFPVFRGEAGIDSKFDLNVYDTVMNIQSRQEWLEDYLKENNIDGCDLVGSINYRVPVNEAVALLRDTLKLEPRWAFGLASVSAAVGILTDKLEQCGIFVAFNGVVGNNTHRVLDVNECRGFALVNASAPYIFVNSGDAKSAQMFTLIHEAAHLMLGVSAGHAGEDIFLHNVTERYCDAVAAEFLVSQSVLRNVWNGNIKWMANKFKVSEVVVARRGHDLGFLSDADYQAFWLEYSHRPKAKKSSKGGDFYLSSVKRIGRTFAIHVRNAVNNRELSYTEAYRLTGLYGNTFQHFMNNNI